MQHRIIKITGLVIFSLSLFTIFNVVYNNQYSFNEIIRTLISVIGIVGSIFLYINQPKAERLLFLWAFAQLIVIQVKFGDISLDPIKFDIKEIKTIIDYTQGFSIKIGISQVYEMEKKIVRFNFNLLAVGYMFLFYKLNVIGREIIPKG